MRYMVVIEEGPASFGAYVPDLPGLHSCRRISGRSIAAYSGSH